MNVGGEGLEPVVSAIIDLVVDANEEGSHHACRR
jgi:hypothetical protein